MTANYNQSFGAKDKICSPCLRRDSDEDSEIIPSSEMEPGSRRRLGAESRAHPPSPPIPLARQRCQCVSGRRGTHPDSGGVRVAIEGDREPVTKPDLSRRLVQMAMCFKLQEAAPTADGGPGPLAPGSKPPSRDGHGP